MPRENKCQERINAKREKMRRKYLQKSRVHFRVKLECHFSWQAQHLVTFWEIAGMRHVVFVHIKCVSKMSPKPRVPDDDFMRGLSSDFPWIILLSSVRIVAADSLTLKVLWQTQYLVRLEADCACSAHWK